MTKEQAIEALKEHKEQIDKKYINTRNSKAIEIVLSMLEEKDKQIDKLKKHNDDLLRKLRNRVKEVKKLEKYSLYKKEFSRLNKQLQNKDKIIDEMSEQQKRKTLMHELMHCYLYEFGIHNFSNFDEEDLCNFSAHSHDIIHKIVKDYYTYKFIE